VRNEVRDEVRDEVNGASVAVDVVGTVTEQLPSALYRVRLEQGLMVTAHIADRMNRNFVRLLVGDRVRVELSPLDSGRGRIVEKL
jgi:translation initiation factor IF-1